MIENRIQHLEHSINNYNKSILKADLYKDSSSFHIHCIRDSSGGHLLLGPPFQWEPFTLWSSFPVGAIYCLVLPSSGGHLLFGPTFQ